jgi:alpha-beta hydrolase superfamily lysophospholipase
MSKSRRFRPLRIVRRLVFAVVVSAVTLLAVRAWEARRGPSLSLWHTSAPPELEADELDRSDWTAYLRAEDAAFAWVASEITAKLPSEDRNPIQRYFDGSPLHPARFAHDWNRSFVAEPAGAPVGAVVLLHGLTDSPYSVRHVAELYRENGWLAVAIRLPAHGTVPGALAKVAWEDWAAAARLAVREATRRVGDALPLHVVGYSNGGALAVGYTLDALADDRLWTPDRVVLLSPMIGITAFARFAGFTALPALLPAFAEAAWLDVTPEFNPFKYNSFPVNAAVQTKQLSDSLQERIGGGASSARWSALPPILTFQSVVDFTVSTPALVDALYERLPENGSELVLYDLNRSAPFGPLLRPSAAAALDGLLPPAPRRFRATILTNASADVQDVVERTVEAGGSDETVRAIGLAYPPAVFSLSHVALPFPLDDALYGLEPDRSEDFGIRLGAIAVRGERATLRVSADFLSRMASNPFFSYQNGRIEETLAR